MLNSPTTGRSVIGTTYIGQWRDFPEKNDGCVLPDPAGQPLIALRIPPQQTAGLNQPGFEFAMHR